MLSMTSMTSSFATGYMNSFSFEISQCRSVFYIMSQSKKKSKLFERKEEKMTFIAKSSSWLQKQNC